ncbi:hypothetical protein BMS3Abin02_02277 [bacterium BMS3Abin02]|nr:hypothetical protein BMS3Abin02_02277 [bacterium BMS3Abin02]GBE21520.1 hypothetical protein BMS3Bbin01_00865 [bacterium BMS3Bbin01]HDH26017.1 hypothetical protein [Actinomycetota bacterium]HDK46143.1 hypothetical protein [Actinomycetota bacterium]HDL49047.1 hypothetical protein [Actinomycetota bacterium]
MREQHTLDIVSLVFGLIFIVIALPVLISDTPLRLEIRWLWPTAVIVAGVLIAGSALRPDRRKAERLETQEDDSV